MPFPVPGQQPNAARFGGQLITGSTYYSSSPGFRPGDDYRRAQGGFPTAIEQPRNQFISGECDLMLNNIIAGECAGGRCAGMNVQSVRPRVIMRLAQVPGKDYSVACGGYIDMAFERWRAQNPQPLVQYTGGVIEQQKPVTQVAPIHVAGAGFPAAGSGFPGTIHDISFIDRMENSREGIEQWRPVWDVDSQGRAFCKENCAFATLFVEDFQKFQARRQAEDTARAHRQQAEIINAFQTEQLQEALRMIALRASNWCLWCNHNTRECMMDFNNQRPYDITASGGGSEQSQSPGGAAMAGLNPVGRGGCTMCPTERYPRTPEECIANHACEAMPESTNAEKTAKNSCMTDCRRAHPQVNRSTDNQPSPGFVLTGRYHFPGLIALDEVCKQPVTLGVEQQGNECSAGDIEDWHNRRTPPTPAAQRAAFTCAKDPATGVCDCKDMTTVSGGAHSHALEQRAKDVLAFWKLRETEHRACYSGMLRIVADELSRGVGVSGPTTGQAAAWRDLLRFERTNCAAYEKAFRDGTLQ